MVFAEHVGALLAAPSCLDLTCLDLACLGLTCLGLTCLGLESTLACDQIRVRSNPRAIKSACIKIRVRSNPHASKSACDQRAGTSPAPTFEAFWNLSACSMVE